MNHSLIHSSIHPLSSIFLANLTIIYIYILTHFFIHSSSHNNYYNKQTNKLLTQSFAHSLIYPFIHLLVYSFTNLLIHPFTHSLSIYFIFLAFARIVDRLHSNHESFLPLLYVNTSETLFHILAPHTFFITSTYTQ